MVNQNYMLCVKIGIVGNIFYDILLGQRGILLILEINYEFIKDIQKG